MERSTSRNSFVLQRNPTTMIRSNLLSDQETGPLSYLVSTPKALRILLTHKIRDGRFQHLLAQWACIFLSLVGIGICAFFLVPTFWAVAFAPVFFLFTLLLSVGAGDLFLKFALEDSRFFEMATQSDALCVFKEDERSLPQPARY